jgi:hypothetical protein
MGNEKKPTHLYKALMWTTFAHTLSLLIPQEPPQREEPELQVRFYLKLNDRGRVLAQVF